MATAIEVIPPRHEGLTIEQLRQRQQQIHQLLDSVMKEGIDNDYAKIPGTAKKSLLKPGAEKIINLFQFVPTYRVEQIPADHGEDVTFRVTCTLSTPSGQPLGEGLGQASTRETKFAWRKAVCQEEYETTDYSKRRLKWWVDDQTGKASSTMQVRENPADKEGNMLKIAKKRALIDCVLTVTGCSNLFTQDRESELEPDGRQQPQPKPRSQPQPQQKNQRPQDQPIDQPITQQQARDFANAWKGTGKTIDQAKAYLRQTLGVDSSLNIPARLYQQAMKWAATAAAQPAEETATTAQSQEEKLCRELFGILQYSADRQEQAIKAHAGDWKKLAENLHKELPEVK